MLLAPFNYTLNVNRTFVALMTGYLTNLAFPRLGEVTRCGVLNKTDGVPVSISFGTVITERLLDFFVLVCLIALDFLIEFDLVFDFFSKALGLGRLEDNLGLVLSLLIGGLVIGVLGIIWIKKLMAKESDIPWVRKVQVFARDMINGLLSLRKVRNIYGFVLSTIGIWILYYLMGYVLIYSIPQTTQLTPIAGLTILVVGGLAMSAPVQAGVGTYHTFVSAVLVLYGITLEDGLFFATILHGSHFVSLVFFGGISAIIAALLGRKKRNSPIPE